jgi:hypothetical protein
MYCTHESLKDIPPGSAVLWRYMDLARLLSLLDTRSLFFPQLEFLRRTDPYEGSFTKANYVQAPQDAESSAAELSADTPPVLVELTRDHWASPLVLDAYSGGFGHLIPHQLAS